MYCDCMSCGCAAGVQDSQAGASLGRGQAVPGSSTWRGWYPQLFFNLNPASLAVLGWWSGEGEGGFEVGGGGGGGIVIVLKSCVAFQNQLSLEGLKQFKCVYVLQLFFGHRSVIRKQDGGALVLCHVNLERNRSLLAVILYLGKKKKSHWFSAT